ncbi:hypothetical protein [Herbaspirillum robiniae]|uniref:MotA/TolQ/ExbB proton channel domain-containing protein n=1 Tax=Herbaspirillum robiniae TaxID=2014887 RepID=A0A246WNP2_9BURK|nr:hypothetical protein [Herbaspirillum robiniae]NUU02604.1 hypothetical protein [Herbaspirillum robiniae]OWY27897.1 hypothetical protein CEJ42_17605 [Herbaspirillum robiniae]
MGNSVWSFFLPHLDGSSFAGLQVVFGLVFLVAIIAIPVSLRRSAHAAGWERRLAAMESDGRGDALATPEEISQAVASAPERWADALPGLLLVFGLLGTFIGLGIALSDAAGLLNGRAEAVSSLNPIMDALGAKFRIASWGIFAFLFLKIWSMAFAYEQARLAWSAKAINARAAQAAQRDAAERLQLIEAVAQSGNALLALQQAEAQRNHVRHAELLEALNGLAGGRRVQG